jgi:intracellular sulfur oxidation DsrE/DsrF family protein
MQKETKNVVYYSPEIESYNSSQFSSMSSQRFDALKDRGVEVRICSTTLNQSCLRALVLIGAQATESNSSTGCQCLVMIE